MIVKQDDKRVGVNTSGDVLAPVFSFYWYVCRYNIINSILDSLDFQTLSQGTSQSSDFATHLLAKRVAEVLQLILK